jgi:hypothetical protein
MGSQTLHNVRKLVRRGSLPKASDSCLLGVGQYLSVTTHPEARATADCCRPAFDDLPRECGSSDY